MNLHITAIIVDMPSDSTVNNVGAYKAQFEPVAKSMGSKQFFLTVDYLDSLGSSQYMDMGQYANTMVYEPFQITRETIQNATEEQLYLLYDLAKSIWSISIDQEYPNIPARDPSQNG